MSFNVDDIIPPSGSISINNGAAVTNSTQPTLTVSATDNPDGSGVESFAFNTTNDWTGAAWIPYPPATPPTVALPEGDGEKTVYARFKDRFGNISETASDTIILDTAPPSLSLAPAPPSTRTTSVSLSGTRESEAVLSFKRNGVIVTPAVTGTTDWRVASFPLVSGLNTIQVIAKDAAGNSSSPASAVIYSGNDTTAPTGSAKINAGSSATNARSCTLSLSASDNASGVYQYAYNFTNNWSTINWLQYRQGTSPTITLPAGDGTRTVYVRYRDRSGNVSTVCSDSIILDTAAPRVWRVNHNCGPCSTAQQTVNVAGQASDISGLAEASLIGGLGTVLPSKRFSAVRSLNTGANNLTLVLRDKANNTANRPVSITRDSTLPWVTITTPADNSITNTSSVKVTGYREPTVDVVQVRRNCGAPITAVKTANGYSANLTLISTGTNDIEVTAIDTATGKKNTLNRTVTYEPAKPISLAVTNPVYDYRVGKAAFALEGSVNASTEPTVTLNIDGAVYLPVVTQTTTPGKYTFKQALTFPAQKTYRIQVSAKDMDNHSAATVRHIIYKKAVVINNDAATTTSPTVTVTMMPPDHVSIPVRYFQYSFDKSLWSVFLRVALKKTLTLPAGAGAKTVYIRYKFANGFTSGVYSDSIYLK